MAEIVNDRDLLIMAAVPRFTPPTDRGMFLTPPAAIFRASGDGSTSTPPSFTFKATLLNMAGQVSFAASNGAKLTVNAAKNEATLDYAAYLAAGAEAVFITAAITVDGEPYTQQAVVTKVADGAQGIDGAQTGVARLYQFSTTVPAKPTGGSTFTWAGAWNGAYTGTDGWGVTAPANPGTPGLRLYVASVSVSAAAKATTTAVSYTGATVEAWAQNGAKGDTGTSGVQSGVATVYQWAATIPGGPTGNALFRWASNAFGEAPAGWDLTPGAAPSLGMTLWAASVHLVDAAANGDTAFNWQSASIMAIGYAGTNGEPGQPGQPGQPGGPGKQGASYVTAYIASSAIAANGAPAQTAGRDSLPAANSSGLAGAWSAAVPTLADGQRMYQTDGIYDPTTDKVTWSIPYWSSLKVATLSAITANLGNITGGSLNIGNGKFTVDASGNVTMSSFILFDPNTGKAILQAGGLINPDFLPASVKNSEIQVGGRNLVPDSGFERGLYPFSERSGGFNWLTTTNAVNAGAPYVGTRLLYMDGGQTGNGTMFDYWAYTGGPKTKVEPGKQYMISFYYKGGADGQFGHTSSYIRRSDGEHEPLLLPAFGNGTTWTRQVHHWTCPAGVTEIEFRFGVVTMGYWWLGVDCLQVEEGNKETDWNLAQEDVTADAQARADAAANWSVEAGHIYAAAQAELARTTAQAYADGKVTAEEQRAIDDATAKANAARIAAIEAAAADAQAKADAAANWAVEAGHIYAAAQAELARVNAQAHADGIVTDAEQRLIEDATNKAEAARVAAVDAAAADATAKAAVAATMSTWAGTSGRPTDISNLVKKGTFEDNQKGTWSGDSYLAAVDQVGAENVPLKVSLLSHSRDCYEDGNPSPITPGETIYVSGWLGTQDTGYACGFGFAVLNKDGAVRSWAPVITLAPRQPWKYQEGSWTVPSTMVGYDGVTFIPSGLIPWIQQDCPPDAPNYLRVDGLWIGRHARGATVGAPAGTQIAGTAAELVAANAGAVPAMSQAINKKLQKDGYDVITGSIGLMSKLALLIGDENNGVWIGSEGIVLVQGGIIKVTIPITGNPTFAGELIAAMGTLGILRLAANGSISSGDFTGWAWPDSRALGRPVTGFYLGSEGLLMGDYYAGKYVQIRADGNIYSQRFRIVDGQVFMDGPTITTPDFGAKTVSGLYDSRGAEGLPINTTQVIGSYSVTMVGAVGAATAQFSFQTDSGKVTLAVNGNSVVVYGRSGNGRCQGTLNVTMTDSNGMGATGSCYIDAGFGNGVPI